MVSYQLRGNVQCQTSAAHRAADASNVNRVALSEELALSLKCLNINAEGWRDAVHKLWSCFSEAGTFLLVSTMRDCDQQKKFYMHPYAPTGISECMMFLSVEAAQQFPALASAMSVDIKACERERNKTGWFIKKLCREVHASYKKKHPFLNHVRVWSVTAIECHLYFKGPYRRQCGETWPASFFLSPEFCQHYKKQNGDLANELVNDVLSHLCPKKFAPTKGHLLEMMQGKESLAPDLIQLFGDVLKAMRRQTAPLAVAVGGGPGMELKAMMRPDMQPLAVAVGGGPGMELKPLIELLGGHIKGRVMDLSPAWAPIKASDVEFVQGDLKMPYDLERAVQGANICTALSVLKDYAAPLPSETKLEAMKRVLTTCFEVMPDAACFICVDRQDGGKSCWGTPDSIESTSFRHFQMKITGKNEYYTPVYYADIFFKR